MIYEKLNRSSLCMRQYFGHILAYAEREAHSRMGRLQKISETLVSFNGGLQTD